MPYLYVWILISKIETFRIQIPQIYSFHKFFQRQDIGRITEVCRLYHTPQFNQSWYLVSLQLSKTPAKVFPRALQNFYPRSKRRSVAETPAGFILASSHLGDQLTEHICRSSVEVFHISPRAFHMIFGCSTLYRSVYRSLSLHFID